jgi:2-dehydro-3-deoxygluconokinase
VVDPLGGGDSFSGGFLYGYLTGGAERGLQYGCAMSALARATPGDFNYATLDEVDALLSGEKGRVQR